MLSLRTMRAQLWDHSFEISAQKRGEEDQTVMRYAPNSNPIRASQTLNPINAHFIGLIYQRPVSPKINRRLRLFFSRPYFFFQVSWSTPPSVFRTKNNRSRRFIFGETGLGSIRLSIVKTHPNTRLPASSQLSSQQSTHTPSLCPPSTSLSSRTGLP